ncbi:MAG: hypothetical protein QXW65_01780 [Candidatus Pacearchaeota archaeon]
MSVFIKVSNSELQESKEALKKIKSEVVELSEATKEFFERAESYARNLTKATEAYSRLYKKLFELRTLLPRVPETIVPKARELEKIEIKFDKEKTVAKEVVKKKGKSIEELKKLREMIEKI